MTTTSQSGSTIFVDLTGTDGAPLTWNGRTPFYSCLLDRRFSYCAYLPAHQEPTRILVAIHGSGRSAEAMRDAFVSLAEETGMFVLAPLFPIGALQPDDEPAYKFLKWEEERFDNILLSMLADAASRFGIQTARAHLFGFSGGAQLAQRMMLVHPDRVQSVSLAAPGYVTLLDDTKSWWAGTKDFRAVFGSDIALDDIRTVPVQILVGSTDLDTHEIYVAPQSRLWVDGANDAGRTRIDRARALQQSLRAIGNQARLDLVDNMGHALDDTLMSRVYAFVREHLAEARSSAR